MSSEGAALKQVAAVPPSSASPVGRVIRGTVALSLVTAVNAVGQIAFVPVALHFWGAAKYGEWVGLTALIGFLSLSDIGIQTHVVNRMCAHYARRERDSLTFDLHSALRFQLPVAFSIWFVIAVGAFFLPLGQWLAISSLSKLALALTVTALSWEIVAAVPMGVVVGTYRASGRLARAGYITAVQRGALFASSVALIAWGADLPLVAASRLLIQISVWAFVLFDLKRLFQWIRFWPLAGSFRIGAGMLGPGLLFLAAALADYLSTQGSLALVQSKLGGAELAHYSTHRTFVNAGRMISAMLAAAVWPELTAMEARGERDGLLRAHRSFCKLNGWMVGALMLVLAPLSGVIYSAWTLRTLTLDTETLLFLVGQSVLWGFWSGGATVLAATNRQGRLLVILLSNAVLGLAFAYLLMPRFGIRGAALGGLLGDVLVAVWLVPATACRALGDRLRSFLFEVVPALLFGLVMPFGMMALAASLLPWAPMRGFVVACGGLVASAILSWRLLSNAERRVGRRIIARLGQRFRSKVFASALGGNT